MAQFVEVMKQARRLCAACGGICNDSNCPLDNGEACRLNIDLDGEDYNELERIIMDWAAEHPEPVYPSWEEAWNELFPQAKYIPCPVLYFGVGVCDHDDKFCVNCKSRPIPAEIAEKLGIRPKEG